MAEVKQATVYTAEEEVRHSGTGLVGVFPDREAAELAAMGLADAATLSDVAYFVFAVPVGEPLPQPREPLAIHRPTPKKKGGAK